MMTEPLRVFHLIKSLGRGGAEVLLLAGVQFGDRDRFRYGYGYFLPWKDAMVASLAEHGCDVRCFAAKSNFTILLSAQRVAQHLRRWRADILHCHLPIAGAVGRLAGRIARIPVIYTEHNTLEQYHRLTRRLNLSTWRWQNRVIAVSGVVASSLARRVPPSVQVRVVPNGVDVERFERASADGSSVRRQFAIPCEAPVVGTVAVFRKQKRLDTWVEAARMIHDRQPNVHFLLVGDGPEREHLHAQVRDINLENVVHFTGAHSDVRPFLAAMDVFLVSSDYEGLPVALLEAMSMECGVVSTTVGGIPEVVRHGVNGLLVDAARPMLLAEAALQLVQSPSRRADCGRTARQTVIDGFSARHMTRQLESIYVEVLNERQNGQ
ncbi:MAG: glycosyltransferase [Gemmatimonadota bacterium]